MKKKMFVAGAIVGSIALTGAAAIGAAGDLVFRTTMARNQPRLTKSMKRTNALNEKRELMQHELEQRPHELVYITSKDGLKLVGHWFETPNAKRTLLLMHGWRSSWARDFGMQMPNLELMDCNMLFVEQRSHGQSEGKYFGFGVLERHDCLRWLAYLRGKVGQTMPIYLFGMSMGAATVLMASGYQLPSNVRGIIADSGFTSAEEILTEVMTKKTKRYPKSFNRVIAHQTMLRAGYRMDDYSTLEAMRVNKTPILFIHGSADTFVPLSMTVRNYEACRADKSILIIDGAPHIRGCLVQPERYRDALLAFIRRCEA